MGLSINPAIARLTCSQSGREVEARGFSRPVGLCSCCTPARPVVAEYDIAGVRAALGGSTLLGRPGAGLWRFAAALPVRNVPEEYAADVGGTPLVRHDALSRDLDLSVWVKNEGTNPSGSFKDRGLAVGVALGAACGARRFCLPTQGNAGVACCLFSARLGLEPALIYMPDGYLGGIYHRACAHFGGEVRFFGPNIAAAGKRMREDVARELADGEFVDMSTFFEPGRLEGKKTMGLEIAESLAGKPLPDWIVYPTGGGTGLVGIWKAFAELRALGELAGEARLPRMVAVQAANCAPVVEAFHRGLDHVEPVVSKGTIADGLDVPGAIMGHGILRVLRESCGTAVAVGEDALRVAFADYGRHGICAGIESAATLAALRTLRTEGIVRPGESVLLLNTGSQLIPLAKA